ncbi:MAG: apolipoprotein N-acyltransferase [bacterium]
MLPCLSAFLLFIPFILPSLFYLQYLAFLPLFYLLSFSKSRCIFVIIFIFLFAYLALHHLWFFFLSPWIPVFYIFIFYFFYILSLALIFSLLLFFLLYCRKTFLFFIPFWIFFEWVCEHVFLNPSLYLAYAQGKNLFFSQWASILPLPLFAFIILLLNLLLFFLFSAHHIKLSVCMILCVLFFMHAPGFIRLQNQPLIKDYISVVAIHAQHSQHQRLDPNLSLMNFHDYLSLSRSILDQQSANLLIWPETSTSYFVIDDPSIKETLQSFCLRYSCDLVLGSKHVDNDLYFNGAAHFHSTQKTPNFVNKHRLMPIGEYWPFPFFTTRYQQLFSVHSYTATDSIKLFSISNYPIALAICLDASSVSLFQSFKHQGAVAAIVLANLAWFEDPFIKERFFRFCQFRAIQMGKSLYVLANYGRSALFNPFGQASIVSEDRFSHRFLMPIY